ncbi:MAG TPA: hypothetical protein VKP69_12035, partial [Isosphaeraceae bacterium]|nr:hypothetical protein [Isosphaeraceae bacterium]
PVSELAAYHDVIRSSFEQQPVRTVAEACERIFQLTGLRRGPSQVRKFLWSFAARHAFRGGQRMSI